MRIAMVCEPDFFRKHVGVRALVTTLAEQARADGHEISYLINDPTDFQDRWFVAVPRPSLKKGNFITRSEWASGKPEEVLSRHRHNLFEVDEESFPPALGMALYALGSMVPEDMFDMAIYSVPWLPRLHSRFPAKRVVGLVHDTIPNSFLFNGKASDDFAYQHVNGFRFYTTHCDEIWVNSAFTRSAFQALSSISGFPSLPIHVIPPMLPYHIASHLPAAGGVERENIVVAVGLLDPRKGMAEAVSIFDAVEHDLHLVICGAIRCPEAAMRDFIARLKVDRLTWYRSIRSETLVSLYARARVALFNSDAEGLGLPVIEAQALGCPVIASDLAVLQEILLPGSIGLPRNEPGRFAAHIDKMFAEPFDHMELAGRAHAAFDPSAFNSLVNGAAACGASIA